MKQLWAWVFAALVVGLAVGAVATRYKDRAAAQGITDRANRQAEAYGVAMGAVARRDAAVRDSLVRLRVEADMAARATLEAKARTQEATGRLAKLTRPAPTDSTNPEWQRIATTQQDVIAGQADQIAGLGIQVTKLDAAYRADSARAAAWEGLARAASVTIDSMRTEVHVAAVGTSACRLLLWDCPSRKIVALAAVGAGAYLGSRYLK